MGYFFKVVLIALLGAFAANAAPASDPQQVVSVVRTNDSVAPLTQVRVLPVDSVQTLRTVATPAVQQVGTIPTVQTVRTVPTVVRHDATHVVHTAPTQTTVQAVRTVPATVQAVRTVPAQTVVHTDHVPVRTAVVAEEVPGVAQYSFGYSIADTETGDSKARQETRNGDVTSGSYSVADPDGRIRTVTYTADAVHGFQAQVTYDGEAGPPAIPIGASTTAEIVSNASPTVISTGRDTAIVANSQPVVVAQRQSLFDNVAVATPVTNVQTVRTAPAVVTSDATHVVHTAPVQAVRTVPTVVRSNAQHLVHTTPVQTVRAVPGAVRVHGVSSPTSNHVVHHADHSTPSATILRSVSPQVLQFNTASGLRSVSPQVLQLNTGAGLRSVPVIGSNQLVGLGSGQFLRAVNTVPVSTTHLVHTN